MASSRDTAAKSNREALIEEPKTHAEAKSVGFKDSVLTVLFLTAGFLLTHVADAIVPYLDTAWDGQYAWTKPIIAILIGAVIKGIDRKKHEDPSPSTGIVPI